MFSALKICAAVLSFSVAARAISNLQVTTSPASGGTVTITWNADPSDKDPCTVALYSTTPNYNGGLAIANDVDPQDKTLTIGLPDVGKGSYTIALISQSNTADVRAQTPPFSIGAPGSTPVPTTQPTPIPTTTPATAKPTSATGSVSTVHVSSSGKPASVSGSHAAASSVAVHSGSGSVVPTLSIPTSGASSLTAPISAPLSTAATSSAAAVSAQRSTASLVGSSTTALPRPSASAKTGAASAMNVPVLALVLVGGLLVGAWVL
ncbi:hypothetical protein C8R43DRAFT_1105468 [Mycena crocata]|nr:hypothetical protein C8R43DRAFT_1105468 [Mycena crocata]